MRNIGILLVLFGAGSFVLNMIGMEFKLLMWIDNWGQTTGWAIRGGMIVVGGLLFFMAMRSASGETATAQAPAEPAPAPVEPTPATSYESVDETPDTSGEYQPSTGHQ